MCKDMDIMRINCFYIHMPDHMHFTISQKVAEVFDLYTQLHDIRISLFSPEGELVYPDSVGRPNCRHCTMLRETLGLDSRCRALDRKMMQASLNKGGMVSYTCHAGMREAAAPIFIGHELAGYVMLGQFRSEAAPAVSPYALRWQEEQATPALQEAYEETAVFPEEKVETLLSMFRHLLEFIMESHLIRHKDYDLLAPVMERIHRHPEQELTLQAAARLAGRSSSTVTRLFHKVAGCSFKQYQTAFRMEQAASMLLEWPHRPVAEIARQLGYEDPLYFSRVFHRHAGSSPSRYRFRNRTDGADPRV
jgi:AraC-like DNA-binding protein